MIKLEELPNLVEGWSNSTYEVRLTVTEAVYIRRRDIRDLDISCRIRESKGVDSYYLRISKCPTIPADPETALKWLERQGKTIRFAQTILDSMNTLANVD